MMLHRRAAQGTRTPRRGEKTQPIFRTIFGAMMLVLVAEILLLVISIYVTNVGGRLNQNAKDMLAMQVRNRVGYMQDLMQNAQDLTDLSDYIDRATLSMVNTGRLDLDALNTDSEQSSALLAVHVIKAEHDVIIIACTVAQGTPGDVAEGPRLAVTGLVLDDLKHLV